MAVINMKDIQVCSDQILDENIIIPNPIYDNELLKNRRRIWRLEERNKRTKYKKKYNYKR